MIRIDGATFDIPDAERGFQRYTTDQRANLASSHRVGFRQRQAVGEVFWTHPLCPNVCYPTRAAARRAAIARLSCAATVHPQGDHRRSVVQSGVSPTAQPSPTTPEG